MKLTYRKLIDSIPSFKELNEMEFMPRTALDLAKLSKQVDAELSTFQDIRGKLVEKYKDTPEDKDEAAKQNQEAEKEFNELLDAEVELNVKPIPFSVLERGNKSFKPSIFIGLDWLLESPEDETPSEPTTPEIVDQ